MNTPDWISVLKDNRVVYYDGFAKGVGSRKYARFKTKAEAEAFATKLIADAGRTIGLAIRQGTTWRDLAQNWSDNHDGRIPEGTMRRRLSALDCWIVPTVGDVLLIDTSLATLLAVADKLVEEGTGTSNFDSVLQTMTLIGEWAAARRTLPDPPFGSDQARRRALRPLRSQLKDPSKKVADDGDETGIEFAEVPSWDDVCALADKVTDRVGALAKSRAVGERYGRAVRIAAGTGLRLCELLALTTDRVDMKSGLVTVDRQIDRYVKWDGKTAMPTTVPKFGTKRIVVVWAKVRDDLTAAIADADENGVLFPPVNGQTWWADGWGRILEAARQDAGWTKAGHWLRHHYGSVSLAPKDVGGMGLPPAEVQRSLGHRKLTTTLETYIQPTRPPTGWVE